MRNLLRIALYADSDTNGCQQEELSSMALLLWS